MTNWSIYYGNGSRVDGSTKHDWQAAPDMGVQVVVEWRKPIHPLPGGKRTERKWAGVTDRVLHTGTDEYDPFGWGVKIGTLIPDTDYERIWQEATHGSC